ncbi:MAG: hypothetical protein KGR69_15995 [Verrucomicrobia bacterium]|nr:hypothetical protein [Verrucomicrobiota bacterium]
MASLLSKGKYNELQAEWIHKKASAETIRILIGIQEGGLNEVIIGILRRYQSTAKKSVTEDPDPGKYGTDEAQDLEGSVPFSGKIRLVFAKDGDV